MITTLAEAEAHQRKHGFLGSMGADLAHARGPTTPKKTKMTKAEAEYGMILEAMKRRGEILRYEFHGITLKWGDLRYTPDFIVIKAVPVECENCGKVQTVMLTYTRLIEVKGGHIFPGAVRRFKEARFHWPEFQFEMHQKKSGEWKRIH
jgi:hypothetical protein